MSLILMGQLAQGVRGKCEPLNFTKSRVVEGAIDNSYLHVETGNRSASEVKASLPIEDDEERLKVGRAAELGLEIKPIVES